MELIEKTGEKFDLNLFLEARLFCIQMTKRIAACVQSGMTEDDGQQLIKDEFKKENILKFWHPSKFRIASDTTKSFRELPDKNIRLQEGDIFFLDVGPVINDHEADYGETFIFKKTADDTLSNLAEGSKRVWIETANFWKSNHVSGEALYAHAGTYAKSLGYTLNPAMAGHRLSDFPHALFSKERLSTLGFKPSKNLWVLEILISDDRLGRGAFFEDILIEESEKT